jgi:aryl-alcohol dehydrogenase-like predicted oxidoreductase
MGVIGMKVLSRGQALTGPDPARVQQFVDYALSQPVHVLIIGCDNPEHVKENALAGAMFSPMEPAAQRDLERRCRSRSAEMLYYRPGTAPV